MNDRYVADVGDFGKYGLLREVCAAGFKLGVVWHATGDETYMKDGSLVQNDGKHISYLERKQEGTFRRCDPGLYDSLRRIVLDNERSLRRIESSGILPEGTAFYSERLILEGFRDSDSIQQRRNDWLRRALEATEQCDAVFMDPDKGLETPSAGPLSKSAPQYAYYDQVAAFLERGQTAIVYQHVARQKGGGHAHILNRIEIAAKALRRSKESILRIHFHRGTARAYLIIPSPHHSAAMSDCLRNFLSPAKNWNAHFSAAGRLSGAKHP